MRDAPKKATTREVVEQAVVAGAGAVPVLGSPLAVAFAMAMGWSYNQRMREWLDDLAEAVTELQEKSEEGLSFEELADDPAFVDAVVHATRAAQATHQQQKLEALRNGVLHCLGPQAPTLDEQARFFRLVEQFTVGHLRLLMFLSDPGAFLDREGIARPDIGMGGRSALIETLPDFRGRRDWYDLLAGDLTASSLTSHGGLHVMQTGRSLWEPATSPLGERFLAFISPG